MFRTTYPNKVFDYMAAGKPTVLVIDGVIRKVIEESGGGVFIPPGDDQLLAEKILWLSTQHDQIKKMGELARSYLVRNLNRETMLDQTRMLLLQLGKA